MTPDIETLVEKYTDNLMRAAFSLGFSAPDAEELVQSTFCAYLDGGNRFERRSQILTYLFGILYNKARETRRYQNRHDSIDVSMEDSSGDQFDSEGNWTPACEQALSEVEHKAQSVEIQKMLQECLEGLSALMRMAFTLKEVEGMDTETICKALNLTSTNLGVVLFRARNKLRDCLTAKGAVIA